MSVTPAARGSRASKQVWRSELLSPLAWAATTTILSIAAGCGGGPAPAGSLDVGARDAARNDAGTSDDAGLDGGTSDGSADTGTDLDADSIDGNVPTDVGCFWPDGALDICRCGQPLGTDCSASACPSGQACASDPCGMHCVPGGSACAVEGDCPSGASCSGGFCTTSGSCVDSRTCPLGYACEAGACVDRRFACAADGACPFGYACDRALAGGTCVRLSRRCASNSACNLTLTEQQDCVDVDGDTLLECQFSSGACVTNAICSGGQTCTPRAIAGVASCGRYGICHDATNCLPGQQCRDLWGDGVSECVDSGGCTTTASCPAHQVCATPARGGPPACGG